MKTEKVSLSLEASLVEEARRRAHGRSLSSYVNEGLRRQVMAERQLDLVAEWEREFGPIPEDVSAEVEALWPD